MLVSSSPPSNQCLDCVSGASQVLNNGIRWWDNTQMDTLGMVWNIQCRKNFMSQKSKYYTLVNSFSTAYISSTIPIFPDSSVLTIRLGPHLNHSLDTFPWLVPIFTNNVRSPSKSGKQATTVTTSTTCSSSSQHQDINNFIPLDSPTGPHQNEISHLTFCSFGWFKKYAKTSPFGVININPTLSTSVLAVAQLPNLLMDLFIPPEPEPPDSTDFNTYVPLKYFNFEDVFSTPTGSSTLPLHQHGIDLRIDIKPGNIQCLLLSMLWWLNTLKTNLLRDKSDSLNLQLVLLFYLLNRKLVNYAFALIIKVLMQSQNKILTPYLFAMISLMSPLAVSSSQSLIYRMPSI